MALDFPSSPSVGQEFSSDTKTWIWSGEQWTSNNVSQLSSQGSADQTLTYDGVQQKWVSQRPFPTWNSTPATSAQNLQLSGASVNGFANWQRALTDVIRNNRDIVGDRVTTPSGTYPGSSSFIGGVLLKDGRVFCVPFGSTTSRIYNPITDTVTIPSPTFLGSFQGGVLLPDGRVFCVPYQAGSAQIYNPTTDTLVTASGSYPSKAVLGGILMNNGKVFCAPHGDAISSGNAYIYDPTTDTLTTVSGFATGSSAHDGAVLLPDGRVYCIPGNSTTARIYNPATNSVTTPSGTFTGTFFGGVLLPNGKVFCVPWGSTTARIYDPITDTLTVPSGSYPGGLALAGGTLLPNGKVFCFPRSTSARIYDPITDTVTTPSGTFGSFEGGVLLPNGKVFCVPSNSTTTRIYDPTDTYQPITLDNNFVTSPFVNKY